MMTIIPVGTRVFKETDNNGPIYYGVVVSRGDGFVTVDWDDGWITLEAPDALEREDDEAIIRAIQEEEEREEAFNNGQFGVGA